MTCEEYVQKESLTLGVYKRGNKSAIPCWYVRNHNFLPLLTTFGFATFMLHAKNIGSVDRNISNRSYKRILKPPARYL